MPETSDAFKAYVVMHQICVDQNKCRGEGEPMLEPKLDKESHGLLADRPNPKGNEAHRDGSTGPPGFEMTLPDL